MIECSARDVGSCYFYTYNSGENISQKGFVEVQLRILTDRRRLALETLVGSGSLQSVFAVVLRYNVHVHKKISL